jgi:CheY-like chemotaxis protein
MRKIELKALNTSGFDNVLEAGDGDEAISMLETAADIGLIISDWNMPNKDGYELLLWVRAHEEVQEAPLYYGHRPGGYETGEKGHRRRCGRLYRQTL